MFHGQVEESAPLKAMGTLTLGVTEVRDCGGSHAGQQTQMNPWKRACIEKGFVAHIHKTNLGT